MGPVNVINGQVEQSTLSTWLRILYISGMRHEICVCSDGDYSVDDEPTYEFDKCKDEGWKGY